MLDDRSYMRAPQRGDRKPVTVILIFVNVACYFLQSLIESGSRGDQNWVVRHFGLSIDMLARGWVWQLLTFQFLHGGILHLALNCLALYMMGRAVEEAVGRRDFVRIYFGAGLLGGVFHVFGSLALPDHFGGMLSVGLGKAIHTPVIGASAGVCGLMGAYAMLFPHRQITLLLFYILPVTLTAWVMVACMALYDLAGLIKPFDSVAHGAHLGGTLGGLIYIKWILNAQWSWPEWKRFRPSRQPRELVKASSSGSSWKRTKVTIAPEDIPPAEFISREVDPILDKISAHGIQSLTERERKILESARAKMSRR